MDYRHEWKYEINQADLLVLRQRLKAVASPDPHAVDGKYMIRSLYFDNAADKALREKLDGISRREKFLTTEYQGIIIYNEMMHHMISEKNIYFPARRHNK